MTKRLVMLAMAASLALAAQPVLAWGTRGDGRPGGAPSPRHSAPGRGGYHGSPGYRHFPGYAYGGRHRGRGYGYGYYPGYRYYPSYYGRSFGLTFGFGGAYVYRGLGWGWPGYRTYGWAPYVYPPAAHVYLSSPDRFGRGDDASEDRRSGEARRDTSVPNTGHVRLEVRPADASVYVDGEFWGPASETRRVALRAGRHTIELVRPGFDATRREVDVASGETSDVLVEMPRR